MNRTILNAARWCAAGVGVFVLVITVTPLVRVVAESLAVDWYEGDGDALIVLGGSMLVPGTGPRATLGYSSYLRAIYAAWMLQTFKFPLVVVTGGDGLAEGMAKLLTAEGVPQSEILLEPRSQNTLENAIYVKQLLQQHSVPVTSSRIVIVTSDYHTWRARAVFAECGLNVRVMPVPDVTKRSGSWTYRLEGSITLGKELCKDAVFLLNHNFGKWFGQGNLHK